jgi:hypothetical protein
VPVSDQHGLVQRPVSLIRFRGIRGIRVIRPWPRSRTQAPADLLWH